MSKTKLETPMCAVYARVSMDKQSESVEHQVSLLKEFASSKGVGTVPDEFVYEDTGVSATKHSIWTRPAMKRLLEDAENGKFQIVMFKGISRFARSTQEALDVLDRLKSRGLRVISYEENYDSEKENSNFIFTIHSAIAEYEAEKISVRVRLGRKEAAREGKWTGKRPFGYDIDENGHLVINEDEAEIVRQIFDMYVNREIGAFKICRYLNEHGIKQLTGALWSRRRVIEIIKNEVYIGNIVYNKSRLQSVRDYGSDEQGKKRWKRTTNSPDEWVVAENTHEPIIDEDTFKQAQKIRVSRRTREAGGPNARHPLSGILHCGKCGRTMFCQVRRKPNKVYRYYICRTYHQYGRSYCDQKNTNADKLEEYIIERLKERMREAYDKNEVPVEHDRTEVDRLLEEKNKLERKIEKVKRDTADLYFERDNMAPESYKYISGRLKDEMTQLTQRMDRLERELQAAEQTEDANEKVKQYMEEFLELDMEDTERLRVLLHRLIERIDIEDEHLDIQYRFAF